MIGTRIRRVLSSLRRRRCYAYRDVLSLPRQDLADLIDGTEEGVHFEAGDAVRTFTRKAPAFIDDPDRTQMVAALPTETITYPPSFVASVRNVKLAGYRTYLTRQGYFFNDNSVSTATELRDRYLGHMSSDNSFFNEETGLRPTQVPGQLALETAGRRCRRLHGRVVVLSSHEPANYGSFVFRTLPKLHALKAMRVDDAPILLHTPSAVFRDFLGAAGVHRDRIIDHDPGSLYAIEHALIPGLRNNQAFLDPETQSFYAALRDRYSRGTGPRKIYVSRAKVRQNHPHHRPMLNEDDLIARLRRLGFAVIQPEDLRCSEQIARFADADLIVGPSGSGLFNVAFCRPGTRLIDLESEPHWLHAHASLFTSCHLTFGIFVGKVDDADPNPVHRRWRVNIEALVERIERFSRS